MEASLDWLLSNRPARVELASPAVPPLVSFQFDTALPSYRLGNSSTGSLAPADPEPHSVPLSLQAHELTLEELKTYMRWYLDILARTNLRTIAISDVYQFLANFKIPAATKEKINRVFYKILALINIGEFFALLRVVAHSLQGHEPTRALIKVKAPVPAPPSILSKKRQNDEDDDSDPGPDPDHTTKPEPAAPLDLDSFTQFMLTGERPEEALRRTLKKLKKSKTVKFSDQVFIDTETPDTSDSPMLDSNTIDYLLPMDQLLSRINASKSTLAVPPQNSRVLSPDPEEKQILKDMEPQMNHFKNLNSVDTILVDGVPANIHLRPNSDFSLPRSALPQPPLLKPNMTGPAQMAQMVQPDNHDAGFTPLRPNVTGPQDMARFFAPSSSEVPQISLQAFTSQMTGDTLQNTMQNAALGHDTVKSPPPVPSTRRARSSLLPLLHNPPSMLHSFDQSALNLSYTNIPRMTGPPVPPRVPLDSTQRLKLAPPPPPPRARRVSAASAQPRPRVVPPDAPDAFYQNSESSSSTANILDDLKALQEEVDRIRDMTGGF